MPDFTELDKARLDCVGVQMGQYLDSLGKTNLVNFTQEEWDELVKVAYFNSTVPF